MRKHTLLAALMTAPLLMSTTAFANPTAQVSSGAVLEDRAKQILAVEPDAREVTVREEIAPVNYDAKNDIQIAKMDLNHDGVFDRDEIGVSLFRLFDGDGNEVIDNIEMKRPRIAAFVPMAKKTIDTIEYRENEQPVKVTVSQEEFMQKSLLSKFDKDQDGLSPEDFLGKSFYTVNVHKDNVIDLYEWKRAYAASVRPRHMEDFNYND